MKNIKLRKVATSLILVATIATSVVGCGKKNNDEQYTIAEQVTTEAETIDNNSPEAIEKKVEEIVSAPNTSKFTPNLYKQAFMDAYKKDFFKLNPEAMEKAAYADLVKKDTAEFKAANATFKDSVSNYEFFEKLAIFWVKGYVEKWDGIDYSDFWTREIQSKSLVDTNTVICEVYPVKLNEEGRLCIYATMVSDGIAQEMLVKLKPGDFVGSIVEFLTQYSTDNDLVTLKYTMDGFDKMVVKGGKVEHAIVPR